MFRRFATLSQIPKGVWVLGCVSMLMDISSEMIHSLLPLFMATTLGASVVIIGLIEGLAEATALMVKVFSGVLSDYIGKRKGLALLGYGMGALSKPLFALASSSGMAFGARMIDRLGKGIRGAPRDALVADVTPAEIRGAAFGLRQSLDTVGAFLGPLLAVAFMLLWNDDFQTVFWIAVIPGVLAVALLFFGLHEPKAPIAHKRTNPIRRDNLKRLSKAYWWVVVLGFIFTLARFSEAFLVLRAQQMAIPLATIPLVMVAMNLVYSLTAYPFGKLSDRISHSHLLQFGFGGADPRRCCTGAQPTLEHATARRRLMGCAYGDDTGPAGNHGRADRTGGTARYSLWCVQPAQRHRPFTGKPWRRYSLGNTRRSVNILGRCAYLHPRPDEYANRSTYPTSAVMSAGIPPATPPAEGSITAARSTHWGHACAKNACPSGNRRCHGDAD